LADSLRVTNMEKELSITPLELLDSSIGNTAI